MALKSQQNAQEAMKILYEGAVFEIMRYGGVARYFTELINRLPTAAQPHVLGPTDRPGGLTNERLAYHEVKTQPPVKLFRKAWRPLQHARLTKSIDANPANVVHWTYYSGLCKRKIQKSRQPMVITVYDFIHEAYPESDPGGKHRAQKARAIEMADRICCISQFTYDELCSRYPSAAQRASVTRLGIGLSDTVPAELPSELVGRPYVLFVGRRDTYKNFETLWHAWSAVKSKIPDCSLVLVGPPMKEREAAMLQWNDASDREFLYPNADDSLLRALYQNCLSFVFPSKMEGFGLPILEAFSNGAPVIASSCDVFKEIAGSAASFFDANDVDALADLLIASANQSSADRAQAVQSGHRQAALFSWDKTAAETFQVYQSLMDDAQLSRVA